MDPSDLWFDRYSWLLRNAGETDGSSGGYQNVLRYGLNSTGGLSNNSNGMPKNIRPIMDSALVAMAMCRVLTIRNC